LVDGSLESPYTTCLFVIIELFSLALTVDKGKAKRVKPEILTQSDPPSPESIQEMVGHFESRFQGAWVVPREYLLVSTKLDTFCYLTVQTAQCYVQSF